MSIISVKDVSYKYRDDADEAVRGVSFEVDEGEFVAILGSNGSGKSTLAKLVNALFVPTAGSVTVCGIDTRDEARTWDVRAACGMVFQNPDNQIVATIVEEDVAFGLENMGVEPREIRRRVDGALAAVGMGEFSKSAPHMLSGGQKQRVAIAGVLAMKPRVIVFDESTAMLDPVGRAEVIEVVRRLNREEGVTVLWITHFMDEAAQAGRILVIDRGEIRLSGAPRDVFRRSGLLKQSGLDVPEMTALAQTLRAGGLDIRDDILTVDEMVVELCRLKSAT
ncbi:MAG: energy-coupling factor transporter ATPase [Clostridia bacterium]|nr:energy-coupling factor transporter ATPase [Clostridia bacterium]